MTDTGALIAATASLCDLLEAENAALRALDIPAAARMLPTKLQAAETLSAAQIGLARPLPQALRPFAQRLRDLSAENRNLLERAIAAQDRVLACIARAIPRSAGTQTRYGAQGREASRMPHPVALSARA